MRTSPIARFAALLLALEGVGLLALAGWQVVALAGGDTGSVLSAVALVVLTVVASAAVVAFAVGVWRDQSWGRSGGIVTQLMILAVALGAATGTYRHPSTGLILGAPAVVAFVALVLASRAASRAARAAEASDDSAPGSPRN